MLSPVSADPPAANCTTLSSLPSAGTCEPSSSNPTSPGTRSFASRCSAPPSRSAQQFDTPACAVVLREVEPGVQHRDERDESRVYEVVRLFRDEHRPDEYRRCGDEHSDEPAAELVRHQIQGGDGRSARQLVWPIAGKAGRCLAYRDPGGRRGEAFERVLARQAVRGGLGNTLCGELNGASKSASRWLTDGASLSAVDTYGDDLALEHMWCTRGEADVAALQCRRGVTGGRAHGSAAGAGRRWQPD